MNKKILVVDDDREILTLLTFMLSRRGYIVETAQDGFSALEKLASSTPDLFIIDIMMPGMSGFELCTRIRERCETAQIPIIICSADANPENRQRGLAVGANDFIPKPVRNADFLLRVAGVLEAAGNMEGTDSGFVGQH